MPRCRSAWRWPSKGIRALIEDPHLRAGLNVHRGQITNRAVADSQNLPAAGARENSGGVKSAG